MNSPSASNISNMNESDELILKARLLCNEEYQQIEHDIFMLENNYIIDIIRKQQQLEHSRNRKSALAQKERNQYAAAKAQAIAMTEE